MKKILCTFIILCCMILTACSFEPRSKASFPTELSHVYYSSEKPYSILSIRLNELLRTMAVTFAKQKTAARFSIVLTDDNFSYSRPDIVDATLPTVMSFSQSAKISIEDNHHNTVVASQSFALTRSITLNANQIYTTSANSVVRQQLNQELVSLVYYWLISSNTKEALHDAIINKAIKHAS